MLALATWMLHLALAAYVVIECVKAPAQYRALEAAIARGEASARFDFYRKTLVFEWISCVMASAVLLLHRGLLAGAAGAIAHLEFVRRFSVIAKGPAATGLFIGVGCGLVVSVVLQRVLARGPRRAGRFLPNFAALLPQTAAERWMFAAVGLSAGICEEVVFRGWLLGLLQSVGISGTPLLLAGAVAFGLAHAYQGPVGVLATGYLGALLCALFGATGALWVPIALHALIDLRFVLARAPVPANS